MQVHTSGQVRLAGIVGDVAAIVLELLFGTEWRNWLTKNREQLFFSDVGGFAFFVAP